MFSIFALTFYQPDETLGSTSKCMVTHLNFASLEAAIEEQLRQTPFSGVIHIAHNDKPLFSHAYGLANRSDGLPNRLNTRFGIASGGKRSR